MNIVTNIVTLLIIAAAIMVAAVSLRQVKYTGAFSLIALAASIAVWAIAYRAGQSASGDTQESLASSLIFLGMTLAASAVFAFALAYTNRLRRNQISIGLLLLAFPALTLLLFWIKPLNKFLFAPRPDLQSLILPDQGVWTGLIAIYVSALIFAGMILILDALSRKPRPLFTSAWTIPTGSILLCLAPVLLVTGILHVDGIDMLLVAFTLAAIGFSIGVFHRNRIESIPINRDSAVEAMSEGWMVLDSHNTIVDINPAAERMVGIAREKAYGLPVKSILGDIAKLGNTYEGVQELEMKRSYKSQEGGWRYLNIRISSLTDLNKRSFGHLVTWRDITERRMAEDARQRARDEMFVLLNAISSEASESMSLEEFLTESIYQIIYPFRSQVVGIFLTDEKKESGDEQRFFLSSHFGLSADAVESMPSLSLSSPLFDAVLKERQPVLIDNPHEELRLPAALRNTGSACLLVVPLAAQAGDENKTLGCICLGRKERPVYSQDEIVRIVTISDHLANLIDNDRRRKLAISLSERQRLMRDLHDSVSQKLYGLVTLTEAAQAALEAGTKVDPANVLARIGENARQAVKEMRLFLYQMQNIDIETEGLISTLHHRLSAVEGRADMKARLLADENISLSVEKQVALYYIAQEALNNILKHARAKNVLVTLKQGRKNVILEIKDDGCGFDPKQVDRAGLGLANMTERVSKIKGKLKITSKPGEGTTVKVTVLRDQPISPIRNRR